MRYFGWWWHGQITWAHRGCGLCRSFWIRSSVRICPVTVCWRTRCWSKNSCSWGCSLFNRAGMVILMSSKGCSPSEGLLAACIWTFVRSFSGMDAAMPGKRAWITKGLRSSWLVSISHYSESWTSTLLHRSHIWGFSPVWTRAWTVNADRWINCFLHPGWSHMCGRTPLWIRSVALSLVFRGQQGISNECVPWRARSLLRAKPLLQVWQEKALFPSFPGARLATLFCSS